jgi:long-chain acyl-CoA synthetase
MLTMSSALDRAERYYAQKKAIVDFEGTWTWGEHVDRVSRLAAGLQGLGVTQGQTFGLMSPNSFRYCEWLHAGYWMGAVPVPINLRLAPPEIAYILENAGCSVVGVDDEFRAVFDAPELASWRDRLFSMSASPADPSGPHHEDLISANDRAALYESREDDTALLLYTGGTTAQPFEPGVQRRPGGPHNPFRKLGCLSARGAHVPRG